MKKPLKIAIATVLILLAGTAGVLYYFLNVKEYDVADEKVEEITKNDYKVDLPDIDSVVDGEESSDADSNAADGDAAQADTESGNSDSDTSTVTASGDSTNSNTKVSTGSGSSKSGNTSSKSTEGKKNEKVAGKQPKKPEITAEMIKAAYRPSFEDLQAQANAKIDALVGAAYSEYSTKKQNGESISITYFYRKYTSAGQALEANTDETFNNLYGALVNDLEARGFSASEAGEFKTQYENAKSARESALIDKAKSAL